MTIEPRQDDYETRRSRLQALSDEALHARFWALVEQITDPLIEEARAAGISNDLIRLYKQSSGMVY